MATVVTKYVVKVTPVNGYSPFWLRDNIRSSSTTPEGAKTYNRTDAAHRATVKAAEAYAHRWASFAASGVGPFTVEITPVKADA